jgi:hypothetical protein
MLTIPMNSVPNALRIAVHNIKADDRALVIMLDLAQDALNIIGQRPVPEVEIDNRNNVTRKGIGEIGVGFGLSSKDSTAPWLLVWTIRYFIHCAGAFSFRFAFRGWQVSDINDVEDRHD